MALIDVLRELANQGKTIVTSIHQPSSQIFQSFDQLILLADGKTIYMVIIYSYSLLFLYLWMFRENHQMLFLTLVLWVINHQHNIIQQIM